ncbi:DUF1905 domain-containing protein [Leucobacter coleopterorum]|uniref:DUF1905 domain-containing protein n=1 Tax=Leucobacter coleopterorum TaxID=2714933 RepID=A0ABX6JZL4_9MICO|nr:YdeI/OmpD-associated family protein [Leucobacter coleopterorum]QIM18269.1 DUF1905 domain-containing protein [Leucobacter coleopterorum]
MGIQIQTTLEPHGPATAIELSDEQVVALGGGKRAAVTVTIGEKTARLRLGVMGGKNLIGLSKAARSELGVDTGDKIAAVITLDDAPREVEVPADLAAALDADPNVRSAFDALPYTHRKEHVRAVEDAKKSETRLRRIESAVAMIRASLK